MQERKIDAIVAVGLSWEQAEENFQKKLIKKEKNGWKPLGIKSYIKNMEDKDEPVYMICQVIRIKK